MSIRLFLLLLAMANTCCAGLRETRDELIARYGPPRLTVSGKEAGEPLADEVLAFVILSVRGGGRHIAILAYLFDGTCVEIRYNPNDYPTFSEGQIALLKQENGGGFDWVKEKAPPGVDELFVTTASAASKGSLLEILKGREIAIFMTGSFAIKKMQATPSPNGP